MQQVLFVSPKVGFELSIRTGPDREPGPLAVYRSADGGRTWPRKVFAVQDDTAAPIALRRIGASGVALVGLPGAVYLAAPGGWRTIRVPGTPVGSMSVSFASAHVWYALGNMEGAAGYDTATLYRSTDTGASWRVAGQFGGDPMTGIGFSAPDSGWLGQISPLIGSGALSRIAISSSGRMLSGRPSRFSAAGTSLARYQMATDPPIMSTPEDGVLPVIQQSGPSRVWLAVTRDGGDRWSEPRELPGSVYAFADATHIVAASGNRIWRSADGGRTWRAALLPKAMQCVALDFLGVEDGWAAVRDQAAWRVLVTRDGGRTWTAP